MIKQRWLSVLPLAVLAAMAATPVQASEVRDRAGMFSPSAVSKATAELNKIERATGVPIVIETIESVPGIEKGASSEVRRKAINELAVQRDKEIRDAGVYILLSKRDHVLSNVLIRERHARALPREQRVAVRDAFVGEFKAGRFDEGLASAVETLQKSLTAVPAAGARRAAAPPAPGLPGPRGANAGGQQQFGLGTLLTIGLGIIGVLFVLRLLGGLFNRSGAGGPAQMGMGGMPRPGMGPGPGFGGPGYGAPGYGGGRGGGFFSGLLGGLGGAMAGNWLYDQMSGRHGSHGHADTTSYPPADNHGGYNPGGDAIVGADDDGGMGASWDNSGGSDGGDWGGGDGGGDWGGGDGGGDWGGGGDGGDW